MGETTVAQSAQPFMGPAPLERAIGWLRGRERAVLTAAAGLQVAVLVAMIAVRAMPLVFGDTILTSGRAGRSTRPVPGGLRDSQL